MAEATDDGLMELLITRDRERLAAAIRSRRLYKRALDLPASDVPAEVQPWVTDDPVAAGAGGGLACGPGRPGAG